LADAHRIGLLHLQLRASNVFVVASTVGEEESVRLVDFGIGPRRKVGSRPVYGQPSTLSPEQIEGKIVSFKSDMFSVGLLLYRMLAGNLPWTGDDEPVVRQILDAPVPPIRYRIESPVPMELWTFLRQMLEKKPIHRPIGMAQMGDRLRELEGEAAAGRLSLEPPAPLADGAVLPPEPPGDRGPLAEKMAIGKVALKRAAAPPPPPGAETAPAKDGAATAPGAEEAADEIDVAVEVDQEKAAPIVAGRPMERAGMRLEEPREPGGISSAAARAAVLPARVEEKKIEITLGAPLPTAVTGGKPKEQIQPSSATMPMEPEIIAEVTVPPPLREPRTPPPRPAEALAAAYRRGLTIGLVVGLAFAIIAFFSARFLFRGKEVSSENPPGAGVVSAADAGEPGTRVTAEGPMQVVAVPDAGAATRPPSDAGSAAPEEEAAVPVPARDAGSPPAEVPPAPAEAAGPSDARAPADAAPTPRPDAARAEAGRADTARPDAGAVAPADAGRAESGGSASAENLARANELVAQGDSALAARDFAAARTAFEEALGLQAGNSRAKIGLGRVAFQQGNFDEAVRYLEPIYRNQGNMDLGVAYVRLGRLQDAKNQFERLVERNPSNTDAQRALEAVNRQLGQ
jgi:serine/threonine-protein kinase